MSKTEVLLVDSGSSDRTIPIALQYPVRIIQLGETSHASASAGRFIGTLHSTGGMIQFLDGDCILDPEWLSHGVRFLQKRKDIAGVQGIFGQAEHENPLAKMYERRVSSHVSQPEGESSEGIAFGAAVLLRRDALERAGYFNPFIIAYEEKDLNDRLLRLKARLWYLKVPMALHMGYSTYRTGDIYRKMMQYKTGYGQVLRQRISRSKRLSQKIQVVYIAFRGLSAVALETVAILLFLVFGLTFPLVIIGLFGLAISIFKTVKGKSVRAALIFLRDLHIEWPWILRGFLSPPRFCSDYRQDVIWIKQ